MLLNVTYVAFLTGQPARHRAVKPCLVGLEIEVDVHETNVDAARVVMSVDGLTELRRFDGKLYRSLSVGPEGFAQYSKMYAFDTRNDVFGDLANEALRWYSSSVWDRKKPTPDNIRYEGEEFVISEQSAAKMLRMGREFVVDVKDQDRAADIERRAREQFSQLVVIDGAVWTPAFELIYAATPATETESGSVVAATSFSHHSSDYQPNVQHKHRSHWYDPSTRFFNALSLEQAAEYAGVPVGSFPTIDVMETSAVSADFEDFELERCGRLIIRELDVPRDAPPRVKQIRDALHGYFLRASFETKSRDALADILSEVSRAVRRDEASLKRLRPGHIDEFVERWNGRPIEILPPANLSFQP